MKEAAADWESSGAQCGKGGGERLTLVVLRSITLTLILVVTLTTCPFSLCL